MADTPVLIPDAFNARFDRFFGWYIRRLVRKNFASVRITKPALSTAASSTPASSTPSTAHAGTRTVLATAAQQAGVTPRPAIIIFNHPSWWDPLVGKLLSHQLLPSRPALGPMDADQLQRFGFFQKIGVFGLSPDHPDALPKMTEFIRGRLGGDPTRSVWITAQGEFSDPRTPMRVRPGAAALAASFCDGDEATDAVDVICVSIEYVFWQEQKPEILVQAASCTPERTNTTGWLKAMNRCMQHNQDELAKLAIARDADAFEVILGKGDGSIHPMYDLWLRLRGKQGAITMDHRKAAHKIDTHRTMQ